MTTTTPPPHDDWFAHATRANERHEQERRASPLSQFWAKAPRRRDALHDLLTIRDAVRGVLRAHGLPRSCRIDLARMGQEGAGAAGFEDAPTGFERPFIFLDKSVYQACDGHDVLDVYCGIGLHEAGHVLHSRDVYRRLAAGMSRLRKVCENLWEDERIEELVRQESPGFAPYLQAAKRQLLEQGEPGAALENWDLLPDMDRFNALIFAFVRFPHRIPPAVRQWTAVNGECVFATLRNLFPHPPRDESDVAAFASKLECLWQRLRALYPAVPEDAASACSAAGELLPGEAADRIMRQLLADAEDRAWEGEAARSRADLAACPTSPDLPSISDRLLDEATRLAEAAQSQESDPTVGQMLVEAAEQILSRAEDTEDGFGGAPDRAGRRFGLADLGRVLDRLSTIREALSEEETEALAELSDKDRTFADSWNWGEARRTEILTRRPDGNAPARYDRTSQQVRSHVAAMRHALSFRLGERIRMERDLASGRPDPRRLAKAVVTSRVFRRTRAQQMSGVAICMLLDESGSMSEGDPRKADVALQVAVLAAESLRGVPGLELEIYSHTSTGADHLDCSIRHLFGKRNHDRNAIGNYGSGEMGVSYDHQAISTVAKLFRESTSQPTRWMLVVSDGQPNGMGYTGEPAITATKEAVQDVRRHGIQVINIAIDDFQSETIFGKDHVVKFTDLGQLVENMRKLIVRLVRGDS